MKRLLVLLFMLSSFFGSAQILTNAQVYDFQPGDIFQYQHTEYYDMGTPCYLPSITTYVTDSVISKYYSAASDTVFYTIFTRAYTPNGCSPFTLPTYSSYTTTKHYTDLNDTAEHFFAFSCAPIIDSFYIDYCSRSVWTRHTVNTGCFEEVQWTSLLIEGCGAYVSFRGGYGGEAHFSNTLTFYKKNGIPCGTAVNVGITETEANLTDVYAYSDATNGTITLNYSLLDTKTADIFLYDISGALISSYKLQQGINKQLVMNKQALSNGIYFYKILVDDHLKVSNKVAVIR